MTDAAKTRELLGLSNATPEQIALSRISRAYEKATGQSVERGMAFAYAAMAQMATCGVRVTLDGAA